MDIDTESRKLMKVTDNVRVKTQQLDVLKRNRDEITEKLFRLNAISDVLQRIDLKIKDMKSPTEITAVDVISAVRSLRKEFPLEYNLLGVSDTIPHICRRLTSAQLVSWEPLVDPDLPRRIFGEWLQACSYLNSSDGPESESQTYSNSSLAPALHRVADSLLCTRIRRCLANDWDVKSQPEPAVKLFLALIGTETASSIISSTELQGLIGSSVVSKLRATVDSWNPITDR